MPAALGASIPQDDAGSGQDAPGTRSPDVFVLPGTVYTATLVAGVDAVDFFAFDAAAGDEITLLVAGSPVCVASIVDPAGRSIQSYCGTAGASMPYTATTQLSGVHYFRFSTFATAYRFSFALDGIPPDPLGTSPGAPAPGADPTCGTGAPITQTGGARDGVVFAALKTGFRAVVAWEGELPELATLTYALDGGATVTLTEEAPRQQHVFLLDALPIGRTLCFQTSNGVADAFVLRNAMTSLREGKYTINLLLTAPLNAQARDIMDAGMAIFSEKLYDATEGRVQPGQLLMLYVDPEHANTGTYTCGTGVLPNPPCDARVDVTFSYDSCAGGAACAPLDGIQRPNAFIMMNSVFDANPVTGGLLYGANEVGTVLVHEFGHYAFGAQDLYVAGDCYDAALSLSIMGGSRSVTEFDDEVHRCPNEASLGSGYVPTWTKMRQRFPGIPARTGPIDEGPHGGGPLLRYSTLALMPSPDAARAEAIAAVDDARESEVPQDDAGSGQDAPGDHRAAFAVATGVLHEAMLPPTDNDVFAFDAPAGSVVSVAVYATGQCPSIFDERGMRVEGHECITGPNDVMVARADAPGGRLFFRVAQATTPLYQFGIGVDAPAPELV